MKSLFGTMFFLCLTAPLLAQTTIPVTFQVNMSIKAKETLFTPATDTVTLVGDFLTDAGLGNNWFPAVTVAMSDSNHDSIYTYTAMLPSAKAGTVYNYKFTINGTTWEGDPNRQFTLTAPSMILPVVWFNRDSILRVVATNTINFTVDVTEMYGTGKGYFDPNTDSLQLMGLDWTGATVLSGNRTMVEDPFQPGIYHNQMVIKGFVGDSTSFKVKAYPDQLFANTGWEYTPNRWYLIQNNGTTASIPTFVPYIIPTLISPTASAVKILFQVDMSHASNRYDSVAIDPTSLEFVGVKGQHSVMGAWVGDWLPTDTSASPRNLLVLNDAGKNGDKVAGDNIWSITVTIPQSDPGGPYLYKYGAFYPGSDTMNNSFHPGDNEMTHDDWNHWFIVTDSVTSMDIMDRFGALSTLSTVTGVNNHSPAVPGRFSLEQNYPNPFNPTTSIHYSLPLSTHVLMEIYNVVGQRIATIVDEQQKAGDYTVTFNANAFASGVYFCSLQADNYKSVKKMVLLK